jgi:hypothetical protein
MDSSRDNSHFHLPAVGLCTIVKTMCARDCVRGRATFVARLNRAEKSPNPSASLPSPKSRDASVVKVYHTRSKGPPIARPPIDMPQVGSQPSNSTGSGPKGSGLNLATRFPSIGGVSKKLMDSNSKTGMSFAPWLTLPTIRCFQRLNQSSHRPNQSSRRSNQFSHRLRMHN